MKNRQKWTFPSLNRLQRLLLYGAAVVWLATFVLSQQRNYQDDWILQDVFWPFVGFVIIFLLVLSLEDDNRFVALLCASSIFVIASIPSLKYQQPYGTSSDAVGHYLATKSLIVTGQVLRDHVYATIPGMHAWLASLALSGGLSAVEGIKFGLPPIAAIMPLVVYFVCRQVRMPSKLAKYTIAACCLPIYPLFAPNGTGFSLVPLLLLLGVLLLREHYSPSRATKAAYTIIALIIQVQLIIWHSTTPMLLPFVLAAATLTPIVVWLTNRDTKRPHLAWGFFWFAILAALLFVAYHWNETDRVYKILQSTFNRYTVGNEQTSRLVPRRLFEITFGDMLQSALVMHGRDLMLAGLAALGLVVVWRYRSRWTRLRFFYAYWLVISAAYVLLLPLAAFGAEYQRFIWAPLAISPFFVGPALWWLVRRLLPRLFPNRILARTALAVALILLCTVSIAQYFICQPLVPKAKAIAADTSGEYIVWLQEGNSAYQQAMLSFAQEHAGEQTRFALDYRGNRQFVRYFGYETASERRLYIPLHRQVPIDSTKMHLFLLHWPGLAGGMVEQVEDRSVAKLTELRETPGWGLIYDNGESFIILVRDLEPSSSD